MGRSWGWRKKRYCTRKSGEEIDLWSTSDAAEAEVTQAKSEPPPDTRARIRGQFIKLAREKSIAYDLDWSTIRIENLLNLRLVCSNPFETDVEEMIDFVRTSQEVNLHKARLAGVPRREAQA